MITWKDDTTYSRQLTGKVEERVPTSWATSISDLHIQITCGHIHYPGMWVMHCYSVGFDTYPLGTCKTMDAEQAKAAAVARVRSRVLGWMRSLDEAAGS